MDFKFLGVLCLFAAVLLAGCTTSQPAPQVTATPTPSVQTTPGVSPPPITVLPRQQSPVKEFTVESREFNFTPDVISVERGDIVRIIFRNAGTTAHSLVVEGFKSTHLLSPGGTESIEFLANQSGTFPFYCSAPGHREFGMEGRLEIT
ncbi:cupredoxin domain-containing protein [Candidatus Micrarchaeota archaeon]|nr:cupredoxin domain-containing protein [Candidatus Micrarchaeota archaeon]